MRPIVDRFAHVLNCRLLTAIYVCCHGSLVAGIEVDAIERSLELRDATLRRVQFDGFAGTFDEKSVSRGADESDEAYIQRCIVAEQPLLAAETAFHVAADFDAGSVFFECIIPASAQTKETFHKYLRSGGQQNVTYSHPNGLMYGKISCEERPDYSFSTGIERLDLRVCRPIDQMELHTVLRAAIHSTYRGPMRLAPGAGSTGFLIIHNSKEKVIAKLRHTKSVGLTGANDSVYRLEFTKIADEIVLTRLDALRGAASKELPSSVMVCGDFRDVDGRLLPFHVKMLYFDRQRVYGSTARVIEASSNSTVEIPSKLDLAPGTYVHDFKSNSKYRVPRSGEEQDKRVANNVVNAAYRRWGPFGTGMIVFNLAAGGAILWAIVRRNRRTAADSAPTVPGEPDK